MNGKEHNSINLTMDCSTGEIKVIGESDPTARTRSLVNALKVKRWCLPFIALAGTKSEDGKSFSFRRPEFK